MRERILTLALAGVFALAPASRAQESAAELHQQGVDALEAGRLDEAARLLEDSLQADGDRAEARNDLGRAYYALGRYGDAVRQHARASALDPENVDYRFRQGIAYIELNEFERARESFEGVLEREPSHRDSWNDLGFVLNRMGQYEAAIPHFDETIELDPDIANPRAHRGFALLKLGRLEEAEADLTRARELNAEYDKNHFYWACLHALRGENDEALAALETAVARGFKWADWIESETSLEPLRETPRYQAALSTAAAR